MGGEEEKINAGTVDKWNFPGLNGFLVLCGEGNMNTL